MVCFIIFCIIGALCLFYIYRKCAQKPIVVKSVSHYEVPVRPFLTEDASKVRYDAKSSSSKTVSSNSTKGTSRDVQNNVYLFEDVCLKSEKENHRPNNNYTNEESNYSGSGRFGGGGSSSSWSSSSSDSCSSSSDSGSSSSSCD